MTEIKDNIDNLNSVDMCMWDLSDIRVVLVSDFEVFYVEEYLKDKLSFEEHDVKMIWD